MAENEKPLREIRINPIIPPESVLIATARGMRPKKSEQPAPRDTRDHVDTCPFCKGNEHKTPPSIAAFPSIDEWQIRIVENLYPILGDDKQDLPLNMGLQQAIDGYGRHEVIIDNARHGVALHEMGNAHLSLLLHAYQTRMRQLYESNSRIRFVLVFKNFGPAAGASIPHTHSQIIAMPVTPQNVQDEVRYSKQHYDKHHHCIFCSLIDEALTFEATLYDRDTGQIKRKINVGQYVIEKSDRFIAIKPFASRYEWEIHILPLHHQADFLQMSESDRDDCARVMQRAMARLDALLGGVQYNYFLHSIPHDREHHDHVNSYHWHIEICPRTSIPTGFELGSGLFVNTENPELAAARLRNVTLVDD